ncbi:HAD hydrolase-like protein [Oscillatoria sp. CS-180]|uniref:HAD hydrolase-like protein n=1 Tax=Oscillatoria sp. CS-180 TaxID=3021720 RepID=UPI00232C56D6|nr:HAD hydrolase-like protein [Oscillatoria sp. CS-180]MDB9527463.1 HAD hydrolase-like protein [Oscillatoria sp. CS-180]
MSNLLFDFDGTIADSLSVIVAITNQLAPEFGYRPTPLAEVDALKGLTPRQLIRYSGIPVLKIPALLRRLRQELRQQSIQIPPCSGMPEVIQQLRQDGHFLAIVTSNTPEVVWAFLATYGLEHCFASVDGGGTLFRKGRLIAQCLERHQLLSTETAYVGDEVRDIAAARSAAVQAVSVTWGFNSRTALVAANPDQLADDPKALRAIADAI